MPELPEVETVRRTLESLVIGKEIKDVSIFWPNIIKSPAQPEQFRDALMGQTIHGIGRRGKFLIFYLDDYAMVSHLRMEGKYALQEKDTPYDKHTHVIFSFRDGTELRYRDVRKFGTMHLFSKGEEESQQPLMHLGPEPFSKEFTAEYLKSRLLKTSRKIKPVLLDQSVVVGIGNIYVDEALFRAGIHPERIASSLNEAEIKVLRQEIFDTLSQAVEKGGSTIRTYLNSQGEMGMFQLELYVYGKKGEACKRCGTEIVKLTVGGRGTHICPSCQKLQD
ncbi:DNA-formamidopyrimidine glycosylase [Bacillus sp. MUM 13]|uniref:DNA-formamidopyrimidine glycosylase n=1 Tax=Bacillus sp. MUM 13 TaxID=1678001 RepID=UPI0008F5C544|nr:DNA-formamidopyrimidine glycosylase [Bacillus sp. MUM 13]OIK07622.1 DNA-formamidopyrimidine glycosylase [Bacillus sp. MUM 13]